MSHEAISATFDQWAEQGRAAGMQHNHEDVVKQVMGQLSFKAGEQVLDLGCGNGWATRLLANGAPGSGAIGIDASPKMIAEAESRHDYTYRARYETGVFEQLDFPDERFDKVFSMEALYYSVDLKQAIAEIHRVLKSGGDAEIVIDCYKEAPTTETWAEAVGLELNWLSEYDWKAHFEEAGFANVRLERVIDSRSPAEAATSDQDAECEDSAERTARLKAGSLWIRASKG